MRRNPYILCQPHSHGHPLSLIKAVIFQISPQMYHARVFVYDIKPDGTKWHRQQQSGLLEIAHATPYGNRGK
jgi:hypothetical protein